MIPDRIRIDGTEYRLTPFKEPVEPPTPEHQDGDPCELPIWERDRDATKGFKFAYMEKRRGKRNEWAINEEHCIVLLTLDTDKPVWLLHAIPRWEVGDWCKYNNKPAKIDSFNEMREANLEFVNGSMIYNRPFNMLEPMLDSDWTVEVAGVKVRVYEDENGGIVTYFKNNCIPWHDTEASQVAFICELYKVRGISIMPYSLHKGDMKRPE